MNERKKSVLDYVIMAGFLATLATFLLVLGNYEKFKSKIDHIFGHNRQISSPIEMYEPVQNLGQYADFLELPPRDSLLDLSFEQEGRDIRDCANELSNLSSNYPALDSVCDELGIDKRWIHRIADIGKFMIKAGSTLKNLEGVCRNIPHKASSRDNPIDDY